VTDLLEVRDLTVHFDTEAGLVEAVDGVTFNVRSGEILGVVGESGSGKSVTALALLRLIRPPGRIARSAVRVEGRDLLGLPEDEMRAVRGARIAGKTQVIESQRHPCQGTAGLDCGRRVRIPSCLFAGAERAGIAAVPTADAAPVMDE